MTETVLLVGGGGREHAIARAVATSTNGELYACASNRNPGITGIAAGYETIDETDGSAIVEYAESIGATLAAIGPESALNAGVADALDDAGIYAFGPREAEAKIETDKAFQREFMAEHGVPGCPDFATFESGEAAAEYIREYDGDLAIKPRGLTGGKGVRVIGDQITDAEGIEFVLDSEYESFVLEERLIGEEFTIQAFVADGEYRVSPAVQDHKRAFEGDGGPNTGGMGSYSGSTPNLPFMTEADYDAAVEIIAAVVGAMPEYKGILYGQFMLTTEGPKVVEFNARFGDPEAMNTLPVLQTDFVDLLVAGREGESLPELEFEPKATVCKYAVPEGYPTDPVAGAKVAIDAESAGEAELFYASVDARDDGIYTTTSRSFAVVGMADSIAEAEAIVEDAFERTGTDGLRVRHDIGKPELVQQRIDHMNDLRR
ncbi:MAG: phosphoribosylamine--glycine ligase [Halobacteriota archaeon]|uniref:phosphoribosylamine--glycine ligase n=1 Tax=Natronomonas sp. TaxID=2184060 RepID=UPI003976F568